MRPKDNSTACNIIHRKIQALSLHHAFSIYSFIVYASIMVIGRRVEICIDELSAFDLDSPIYFGYSVIFCGTYNKTFVNLIWAILTTTNKAGRQVLTLYIWCRYAGIVFQMRALHEIKLDYLKSNLSTEFTRLSL